MTKPDEETHEHDWTTAADGLRGLKAQVCAKKGCGRVRLELEVRVFGSYSEKWVVVELDGEEL